MSSLAFGISKMAVELLADKVKSAIKEEAEQWRIVQRDLVFITGEFEMMQCFLNTADKERIKNSVVRTWVRQVHDLSHDTEDCIEFALHLDGKRSWWIRMLPSCVIAAAQPLDEAVAEMKLLKARVEDVSQRNLRYNLVSDSGSKHLAPVQPTLVASCLRALDIFVKARDVDEDHSAIRSLKSLITRDDDDGLRVMSVCGVGGDLGTASIVRNVYDDPDIRSNFKLRAWVKLAHPFSSQEFLRNLTSQFSRVASDEHLISELSGNVSFSMPNIGLMTPAADISRNPNSVHPFGFSHGTGKVRGSQAPVCREDPLIGGVLSRHRYLVVLEDLSSMADWDAFRAYFPGTTRCKSRIMVTTQKLEIATLCTGWPYQVSEIKAFSPDHSVYVFFKESNVEHLQEVASNWLSLHGQNPQATRIEEQIHPAFGTVKGGARAMMTQVDRFVVYPPNIPSMMAIKKNLFDSFIAIT